MKDTRLKLQSVKSPRDLGERLRMRHMGKFSAMMIFLSIIMSCSLMLIPEAHAQEVVVSSVSLEKTMIIKLVNNSDEPVSSFKIWFGTEFVFESFKTQNGWTVQNGPQVIVFATEDAVNTGESVKFGIKTNKVDPIIGWKASDEKGNEIDNGVVTSKEILKETPQTLSKDNLQQDDKPKTNPDAPSDESITDESVFRIIPEKPNVGSPIRVAGNNFGTSQEFEFYMDSKKLGSFTTDTDGGFITTMKIPDDKEADRVEFKIKDKDGKEIIKSIRIEKMEDRIPKSNNIKLAIDGIPDVVYQGDFLDISGTGDPNSAVTIEISSPDGLIVNARTAEIDSKGNWEMKDQILIPLDAMLGRYSATLTDGRQDVIKQWTVESGKVILIESNKLKFQPGETMKFNGTARPDTSIEVTIENQFGIEIFSDIIQTDGSGRVEFEFQTRQSIAEGTYTMIASQEKETEFVFVGIGQLPSIPINIELDKTRYKSTDKAIITFTGKGSTTVRLTIVDSDGKSVDNGTSVKLQADGRGAYSLDLSEYASGIYTATVSKGSSQSEEQFAVGNLMGATEIDIRTTKSKYLLGEAILVIADTDDSVLLSVTLNDPDGNVIKTKEIFLNNKITFDPSKPSKGKYREYYSQSFIFRTPSDGTFGTWEISANSGSTFGSTNIEIVPVLEDVMQVSVQEGVEISGYGQTITIKVIGAKNTVDIEIIDKNGNIIKDMSFLASKGGEISQPWLIPKDTEPGTYTIRASDKSGSAETTYNLQ